MNTLAQELVPTYLRVGGADADFLVFNQTNTTGYAFDMTVEEWDQLNNFSMQSGWNFIFDFNVLLRKNGKWDPTNAMELLRYTKHKGYEAAGYELGNEPDLFSYLHDIVTPSQLVADIVTLKNVATSTSSRPYLTLGPDASNITEIDYFHQFLEAGGGQIVDKATFHHYYMSSTLVTVEKFHNVTVLESLRPQLELAMRWGKMYAPDTEIWLGETSSSYGGGALNISDRYVAGFVWMDKLCLASLIGLKGVIRQSFYGGNYGLIDVNLDPNPDYYITKLYKTLVGSPVLNITQGTDPNVRVYAHCTNTRRARGYEAGSVTVYLMNIGSEPVTVDINGGITKHLYILSPGDESGLTSQSLKLNGILLKMPTDGQLPPLNPVMHNGSIELQGYGMAFVVMEARKKECF
ncbi:hypothetical protein SNE40_017754 [Patella caerulea]